MVSQNTFEYLTSYFAEALSKLYADTFGKAATTKSNKELKGYGGYDKKYQTWREDRLWTIFDGEVCNGKDKLIRADKGARNLYAYNGMSWERIDTDNFMKELVKRTMRKLEIGLMYLSSCDRIAKELLSTIKSSDEYLFRPSKRYIAFKNGIFDLKDGKLKTPSPKYLPTISLDFDYMSEDECNQSFRDVCKRWDNFIGHKDNGVFPVPAVAKDIQTFCGALLLDRHEVKFEYMACIFGPGSNGKSVFVDAIMGVFGREYCSTFTPAQLFKEGANSSFCVADLEGKIVNVVGDLDNKDFSGGSLKRYISGEPIMAREPYGKKNRPVEPPLMICCTNEMPEAKDDSYGHHRRLLPFESTKKMWTEKDKDANLTAKLTTTEARQYIFNWIYKGYRRIMNAKDNSIIWSDITVRAQERFRDNANSMRKWWTDSGYVIVGNKDEGKIVMLGELFREYCAYCEACYYEKRDRKHLAAMLRSKGVVEVPHRQGVAFLVGEKETKTNQ